MKRLRLEVHSQTSTPVHETYIPDAQRALMGDFIKSSPGGDILHRLLYENPTTTRDDIKDWSEQFLGDGFRIVWFDDLEKLRTDPSSELYSIIQSVQVKIPSSKLINTETGFIQDPLYFALSKERYVILGNDHDLTSHLPFLADPETAQRTRRLAEKWYEHWQQGNVEQMKAIAQLWQVLQESRIIIKSEKSVSLVGGYFSAFANEFLTGKTWVNFMPSSQLKTALEFGKNTFWKKLDKSPAWLSFLGGLPGQPRTSQAFYEQVTQLDAQLNTISFEFHVNTPTDGFASALAAMKADLLKERARNPFLSHVIDGPEIGRLIDAFLDSI